MSNSLISAALSDPAPEKAALPYSAFSTLVNALAARLDDGGMEESWKEFISPTPTYASTLVNAQSLLAVASARDLTQTLESIRFTDRGLVNLRREFNPSAKKFAYKVQIVRLKPTSCTEEHKVLIPTIVTAVRGGISLLAAALAKDPKCIARIKELLVEGHHFAKHEELELMELIEDAKTPEKARRNSI